jgi:hypothetical protein
MGLTYCHPDRHVSALRKANQISGLIPGKNWISTAPVGKDQHICLVWEAPFGSFQSLFYTGNASYKWQPLVDFQRDGGGIKQKLPMQHRLQGKIQEKAIFFPHTF